MAGLSKANLATLIGWLSHDLEVSTTTAEFTDAVMYDVSGISGPMVGTNARDMVKDIATYPFPTTARKLLAVIAVDTELMPQTSRDLEMFNKNWRDDAISSGDTRHTAYMVDEVSGREYSIYPIPSTGTVAGLTTIYTEARTTAIPEWLALPLAFDVMSREFAYPSDHQDKKFSTVCGQLAALLYALLGL